MSTKTTTSRKVLIPFATLVAAGAVAIGSGATFSSTTDNSVSVTSGELVHTNTHGDGATLTLDNIVPGDSMTGTVVVTNTGDLDSTLDFASSNESNSFSDYLTITITADGTNVYDGPFGDLDATQDDVTFDIDDQIEYTFVVSLDADAGNDDQQQAASADFTWTQNQLDGDTLLENWIS